MAYRWVSKTSTIRLGFEPPLLLSVSKTACPERMQLVLPNSRTPERSSSEKRICIGSVRAQQALTVTLAQSLTRGTRGTSRGGSSAGSAAAVASGMCYATLDTDAIGSCRLPAACCGVVGFKGTYGLINPKGILDGEQDPGEMIRWFAHPGITTRSVADTALVLDVLAERREGGARGDYFDGLAEAQRVRVGVAANFQGDDEVSRAFEEAVEIIHGFDWPMKRIAVPLRNPGGDLSNIEADRKSVVGQTFKDIDVLLLPTTTNSVPAVKDVGANVLALSPENTVFANYYGLPAMSVLCGFDGNGLPLGLQVVGKPWDEAAVLYTAYRYETKTGWNAKHPTI